MGDQNITALPVKTAPAAGDQIMVLDQAEGYLIDYKQLAKAFLAELQTMEFSQLQTVAKNIIAAVNELNSNCVKKYVGLPKDVDFNTIITSGFYRLGEASNSPNKPPMNCSYGNMIVSRGGDTIVQMMFPYSDATNFAVRTGSRIGIDGLGLTSWAIYSSK